MVETIRFNKTTRQCPIIEIFKKNYEKCELSTIGDKFWGNSKFGKYGAGLCKTDKDKFKPARTGRLGELAVAQLLGVSANLNYINGGDSEDFIYHGKRVDVKTATRNYGKGLIYHKNEWGKIIPLEKDLYIFSFIKEEDRSTKYCKIAIVGYLPRYKVKRCPIERSRVAGARHLNYEVRFCDTYPIERLL